MYSPRRIASVAVRGGSIRRTAHFRWERPAQEFTAVITRSAAAVPVDRSPIRRIVCLHTTYTQNHYIHLFQIYADFYTGVVVNKVQKVV